MGKEQIQITHPLVGEVAEKDFQDSLQSWSPDSEWGFLSDASTQTPKVTDHEIPDSPPNSLRGIAESRYEDILGKVQVEWRRVAYKYHL